MTEYGRRAGWASVALVACGLSATPPAIADSGFEEQSVQLGIDFVHQHFGTGEKYMPENMGPGVVIFDYDGDGLLDIYLVQGAPLGPAAPDGPAPPNQLFRQTLTGGFEDVTERSGVGDTGYGMGASFGDYDRDGDLDLYVSNFGPNVLYRNRGDGSFEKVPGAGGAECPLWSTSAGFFDPDADGDLDIFAVNYVDFTFDNNIWCGNAQLGIRGYCHPDVYGALPECFYRNEGDGTFTDVSSSSGLVFGELGLGFSDFNGDDHLDVFVANDGTMNQLYLGDGEGGFREEGLLSGVGFNGSGVPEASMGVEIGDVDGDGVAELFLTHLDAQTNTLYRDQGEGFYVDITEAAGLMAPSLPWVGFGTVLLDHDSDGDLDLFVANGHIIDNIERFEPSRTHRQPAQLFDNPGDGRFREVSERLLLEESWVGRGAATGDLDRDGDADLVVVQNGGPARVLINQMPQVGASLAVELRGSAANPQGFGARVDVRVDDRLQVRWMRSARSYLSQSAPQVRFGLGGASQVEELTVSWPAGSVRRYQRLSPGRHYVVPE
jgi:hypothetical protein